MKKICLVGSLLIVVSVWFVSLSFAAEKVYTFKLSVHTTENHHRNKGLKIFRCLLEKNSKGRIKVEYYHSAQLYHDKDIPKALKLGTIEMGIPAIEKIEGIDPNAGITGLPMFYGLPVSVTRELIDGQMGQALNKSFEKKLDVKVLGKWYFHGYSNIASKTRPIAKLEDWKGLKMRYPGGTANALRLKAMGSNPIRIPWPDVPMAMVQGTVDGLIVTFKSFESAKLWETGTLYATECNEWYVTYIPMMNGKFWRSLPKDLKKIILDTWEEHADMQRAISDYEQNKAEGIMKKHGVKIAYPDQKELGRWRAQAMTLQDQVINKVGMDRNFVKEVQKYVEEAMKK